MLSKMKQKENYEKIPLMNLKVKIGELLMMQISIKSEVKKEKKKKREVKYLCQYQIKQISEKSKLPGA